MKEAFELLMNHSKGDLRKLREYRNVKPISSSG